jgi:hypothetical protein
MKEGNTKTIARPKWFGPQKQSLLTNFNLPFNAHGPKTVGVCANLAFTEGGFKDK